MSPAPRSLPAATAALALQWPTSYRRIRARVSARIAAGRNPRRLRRPTTTAHYSPMPAWSRMKAYCSAYSW